MRKSIEIIYGKVMKKLSVSFLFLLISICYAQVNQYAYQTNVYIQGNKIGIIKFCHSDLNHDGILENLYYYPSLIKYGNAFIETGGPKASTDFKCYAYTESYRLYLLNFLSTIFLLVTDNSNNLIGIFENKKEIREWTKAYTHDDDNNSWITKYNLGYTFKDLQVKGDKIYLLTGDGGSGSTGGFNIEHVFTVKNGKPVTLVSRFVPNPEKEKAIKAMQKQ